MHHLCSSCILLYPRHECHMNVPKPCVKRVHLGAEIHGVPGDGVSGGHVKSRKSSLGACKPSVPPQRGGSSGKELEGGEGGGADGSQASSGAGGGNGRAARRVMSRLPGRRWESRVNQGSGFARLRHICAEGFQKAAPGSPVLVKAERAG